MNRKSLSDLNNEYENNFQDSQFQILRIFNYEFFYSVLYLE